METPQKQRLSRSLNIQETMLGTTSALLIQSNLPSLESVYKECITNSKDESKLKLQTKIGKLRNDAVTFRNVERKIVWDVERSAKLKIRLEEQQKLKEELQFREEERKRFLSYQHKKRMQERQQFKRNSDDLHNLKLNVRKTYDQEAVQLSLYKEKTSYEQMTFRRFNQRRLRQHRRNWQLNLRQQFRDANQKALREYFEEKSLLSRGLKQKQLNAQKQRLIEAYSWRKDKSQALKGLFKLVK